MLLWPIVDYRVLSYRGLSLRIVSSPIANLTNLKETRGDEGRYRQGRNRRFTGIRGIRDTVVYGFIRLRYLGAFDDIWWYFWGGGVYDGGFGYEWNG